MCGLTRTGLTVSQKAQLAASALAAQEMYGRMTEAATRFAVSRPTVYRARADAEQVLTTHYASETTMAVDEAQIRRTVIALRVMAPNSLRAIEGLVPIVYPGVQLSYARIQEICAEAEAAARALNAKADLSGIEAAALDEMFSQGAPVLAGVDLDSGYLFSLALRQSRGAEDWAEVLGAGRDQGLDLRVVVKDAALGIARGVDAVFPNAEQRDDCFHVLYAMGKRRQQLERRAFAAIEREFEAEHKLCKALGLLTPPDRDVIHSLRQKLNGARIACGKKMKLHDDFERILFRVQEAMELCDLERGILRDPATMQADLHAAAEALIAMADARCQKLGRYLNNRVPGLVLYAIELKKHFDELGMRVGETNVRLACCIWRLRHDWRLGRRPWDRRRCRNLLFGALACLHHSAGPNADQILDTVDALWQKRHRASSAIEGFNAFLRPFLYVHKGVTQGFLELLRAYYNVRMRRWGRHKGTTAHETLRGQPVGDWLTHLGYPPSPALH